MNSYRVTYFLNEEEKVVVIQADNTGEVFSILENQDPEAHNIKIERIDDD